MGDAALTAEEALAKVPLFSGLPPPELNRLAACTRLRRYARGEVIFLEGDPGAGLCIIASGRVKIVLTSEEGREIVLNVYGPGEFLGEFALLDGEPRSADAVAQEPCRVFWLRRDDFHTFLESYPRAAAVLLAVLSRRLRHTTRLVQDAAFRDVPARLARVILTLAEDRGAVTPAGVVISTRLTQAELASMVGSSRETVNKCLRAFQDQAVLRYTRGALTILRPDELRARAGE